ncbi:MAG TPA: tRNA (N(6)-L-threonylcarbamoyladenosine(37)-C(2))-methylthiotransferase MtaB [Alphaproteobacteria bacterium]|nr:tRNA (N(6)-L-threonylcarbamoyladenosine(37)-C(2))-methylthiotransferase MtaB [Alphaproteobacteria bacterium]
MNRPLKSAPSGGVAVLTFGCRLNACESEVLRRNARAAGVEDSVIVNTCAVTAEAERQARQAIRRARRVRPHARIVVTGCAAQISPERYAAMPEVDWVIGNSEKLDPGIFGTEAVEAVRVNDIFSVRDTAPHLIEGFEGRTRAFLQVQNGCDHRCTFCVIPFGRGNSRSVPAGAVLAQARALAEAGYRELVLTGVDLSAWGGDLPGRPGLARLVRALLDGVPEIVRLRFSSIDVAEVDGELLALVVGKSRIMPHLHLSLQSGDDMILKRMKRRHSREDAIGLCARLRAARPGFAFGADLIAGFPTETEAMFANTLDLVEACGLTHLHVFPYSPRPGTPAERMPQVPRAEIKRRAAELRARGEAAKSDRMAAGVGTTVQVLVEQGQEGRTEDYFETVLERPCEAGQIVAARAVGVRDGRYQARAADG